jgi:hypothetical protein
MPWKPGADAVFDRSRRRFALGSQLLGLLTTEAGDARR